MFRRGVLITGVILVAASVATMATAQPGGGFGGGFGGGMFGGGGLTTIMALLNMDTVQTELKLTDDQKTKVTDLQQKSSDKIGEVFQAGGNVDFSDQEAFQKQMAENQKKMAVINKDIDADAVKLLTPEQLARVNELQIQRDGATSLTREEVQKKLSLSDDEVAKIKKLQDSITNQPQIQFGDPNVDFQAEIQKRNDFRTKAQSDMVAVLTADQKTAFEKMKGKEFTFPARGRGRGGFGGPGGPGGGGPGPGG